MWPTMWTACAPFGPQLERIPFERLHIVLGMVNPEDLGVLAELPRNATDHSASLCATWFGSRPSLEQAKDDGLLGTPFTSVTAAFDAARKNAHLNDLVLVTGSVFGVGEVI